MSAHGRPTTPKNDQFCPIYFFRRSDRAVVDNSLTLKFWIIDERVVELKSPPRIGENAMRIGMPCGQSRWARLYARPLLKKLVAICIFTIAVGLISTATTHAEADDHGRQKVSRHGDAKPLSHGTPQKRAAYQPGATPYQTEHGQRPKYFVPPTNPRTPTWKMYGTPPGAVPGNWPTYAPLGFGGYRFPAVGSQAYR